ncbi:hypothetical protein G5X02_004570 [Salmonella enterica]|nr:hypothetical protein [Salmonella enterica]EEO7819068.1 hypothetical protein [Salmonella enterica]EEO8057930.1 hypothetical protein [Salmonella enterica]EEP0046733.1 hypothetical protein [Salmonella enterica]
MDNEFYTLLTDRGMAKIASALADKKQLHLQKMAVGDGGGQYYEPTASQPDQFTPRSLARRDEYADRCAE